MNFIGIIQRSTNTYGTPQQQHSTENNNKQGDQHLLKRQKQTFFKWRKKSVSLGMLHNKISINHRKE